MKVASLPCIITSLVASSNLFALAAERTSDGLRGRSLDKSRDKGQAPLEQEGNRVSKNNQRRHLNDEPFDPTKVKVLVKYKNEQGKQEAKKKAAIEGYESERFSIVSM